jgi:hypothetical protein
MAGVEDMRAAVDTKARMQGTRRAVSWRWRWRADDSVLVRAVSGGTMRRFSNMIARPTTTIARALPQTPFAPVAPCAGRDLGPRKIMGQCSSTSSIHVVGQAPIERLVLSISHYHHNHHHHLPSTPHQAPCAPAPAAGQSLPHRASRQLYLRQSFLLHPALARPRLACPP